MNRTGGAGITRVGRTAIYRVGAGQEHVERRGMGTRLSGPSPNRGVCGYHRFGTDRMEPHDGGSLHISRPGGGYSYYRLSVLPQASHE